MGQSVRSEDTLSIFIADVISKWGLVSPTIIYQGDAPEICFQKQMLCLDQEDEESMIQIVPDKKDRGIRSIHPFQYILKFSWSYSIHFDTNNTIKQCFHLVEDKEITRKGSTLTKDSQTPTEPTTSLPDSGAKHF